jgi:hypothetical protein
MKAHSGIPLKLHGPVGRSSRRPGACAVYVVRKKWLPPGNGNRDFFSFVATIKPPVALVAAECVLDQEDSGAITGFILAD